MLRTDSRQPHGRTLPVALVAAVMLRCWRCVAPRPRRRFPAPTARSPSTRCVTTSRLAWSRSTPTAAASRTSAGRATPIRFHPGRPTARQIAFSSDLTATDGGIETMTMNATGGARTPVTATARAGGVQGRLVPDGTRLVVSVTSSGVPRIYTMNADGTSVHVSDRGCRSRLVARRHRDRLLPSRRPRLRDLQDRRQRQQRAATDRQRHGRPDPDWSPNGSRIAFVATRTATPRSTPWTPPTDSEAST